MKLYRNSEKRRYRPLQSKTRHRAPACAGYADRGDARQYHNARAGTRDAPAVPGQIVPELGRFAVGGAAGVGLWPDAAQAKAAFLRPFCDFRAVL